MEDRFPIVLFSDTVTDNPRIAWLKVCWTIYSPLRGSGPTQPAAGDGLRAYRRNRELELLRNAIAHNDQTDRLTAVYTRETLLSLLFRETDRVQRMKTELCFVLFDIDDFGHWNSRLGAAACDDLLAKVVERVGVLLRSYDLLGRVGKDEFLAGCPAAARSMRTFWRNGSAWKCSGCLLPRAARQSG